MFNICEAFFSGFYFYREEFSSSLLGYVLSPLSSHGMGTAPLKSFIGKLLTLEMDTEYRRILEEMRETLSREELSHPDRFLMNPLTDEYRFASSLEFKEIDLLIRIDHKILLFENKIYPNSVGKIGEQILQYKESLGSGFDVVPIAIFPSEEKGYALDHVISIFWNGNHGLSLFDFLKEIHTQFLPENSSLGEFIEFAERGYETSSRPRSVGKKTYDEILGRFDPAYREIISTVFPINRTVLGEDMANGGCLLYCLPLAGGQVCYPFRLVVNGKCEIMYQGLLGPVFLKGKNFDGTHSIRDLIRLFLRERGFEFHAGYHFDYTEFADPAKQEAFGELLGLLTKIGEEKWDRERFYKEFLAISKKEIDYGHFQTMLRDMQQVSEASFQTRKDDFMQLYRLLLSLERKKPQNE